MSEKTPIQTLSEAYAGEESKTRAARRRKRVATAWQPDERLEAAISLLDNDPASYASLSPQIKTSVGFYLAAKEAAKAEGLDTTGGNDA